MVCVDPRLTAAVHAVDVRRDAGLHVEGHDRQDEVDELWERAA